MKDYAKMNLEEKQQNSFNTKVPGLLSPGGSPGSFLSHELVMMFSFMMLVIMMMKQSRRLRFMTRARLDGKDDVGDDAGHEDDYDDDDDADGSR